MSAMANLYVKKITAHEINKATGEEWKIEDVPIHWREEVREELENN